MTRRQVVVFGLAAVALTALGSRGIGQDQPKVGFKDTPMLPGGKWHVHDGDRPPPAGDHAGNVQHGARSRGKRHPTPSSCSTARTSRTGAAGGGSRRSGKSRTGRW